MRLTRASEVNCVRNSRFSPSCKMGCLPGLEEKHLGALISPSIVQLFSASTNRWPTCTEKMPATSATETAGIFRDAAEQLERDVDAPHISLKLEQSDEVGIPEAACL